MGLSAVKLRAVFCSQKQKVCTKTHQWS